MKNITDFFNTTTELLGLIIPLLITLATVFFLWGVIKYIAAAGDEKAVEEGKKMIIYGILGLFLIFSMWGIVRVAAITFGVHGQGFPAGPTI